MPNKSFVFNGVTHHLAVEDVQYGPGIVEFSKEPTADEYAHLIEHAATYCYAFSLVWRDALQFDESAKELFERLGRWLCYERHTDRWPGTQLFGARAWVGWYVICEESKPVLLRVSGLYQWMAPSHPEDLSIYCEDGSGWLGSIAHEKEGWLDLTALDRSVMEGLLARLRAKGVVQYADDQDVP